MPRGGNNNLIPHSERSKEEARENGRKGGKASGEARRQKATAKKLISVILDANAPAQTQKSLTMLGVPETEHNVRAALLASTTVEAMKGNLSATKYLMELAGETGTSEAAPTIEQSPTYTGLPAIVMGKAFVDLHRDIKERRHLYYDLEGGRGSLKSTTCGLETVDEVMLHPNYCALAIKQVKDTIKDSVYAQIVWAIDMLGLSDQFKCTKNPMEITRIKTGQKIYFRGADDPMKIKSIKPPKDMHIGIVWIEEADQLHGEEGLRNILQSAVRGGDDCLVLRSYNVPRSPLHYINKAKQKPNPARLVHHSHFNDAPPEWLGKSFWDMAAHLKETNPMAYRHEYDGEAVGSGANVFENVTTRDITDDEIDAFDRTYYGLDWGYYPDPLHFCECYYHAGTRRLYIYGEQRYYRLDNEGLAIKLEPWRGCLITADSEDKRSIADLRSRGYNMRGAIKGPGSVDYSHKWLASLSEIIIDITRCPITANEFLEYEFERDKDDNLITGYPDKNNHSIDAVRYALEEVWRRRGQ